LTPTTSNYYLDESFLDNLGKEFELPSPGSLIQILSNLFWHDKRNLRQESGQIYFVVETALENSPDHENLFCEAETLHAGTSSLLNSIKINLMIDGSPTWVEVDKSDYNLLCVNHTHVS